MSLVCLVCFALCVLSLSVSCCFEREEKKKRKRKKERNCRCEDDADLSLVFLCLLHCLCSPSCFLEFLRAFFIFSIFLMFLFTEKRNGPHQANRSQVHRRKGSPQVRRLQGKKKQQKKKKKKTSIFVIFCFAGCPQGTRRSRRSEEAPSLSPRNRGSARNPQIPEEH